MIEIIPNWHPVFVHFTVALLSVSLGLFIVGKFAKCDQATLVAKWNLWIGAAISLLTLAAGFYAYNTVAHDTPSHEAMTEHKNLALITLALLLPVVVWSVLLHRRNKEFGVAFLGLFLVVGAMLASTAWHGGEVVYRYGLGVMSLPKTDSHDHGAHGHGGESASGDHPHDDGHNHGSDEHGDSDHGHDSSSMMDMSMDDMDMGDMGMDDMSMESDEVHVHDDGSQHVHGKNDGDDHLHDDGHDHAH